MTKLHTEEQMIVSDAGRAVEVFLCRPHGAPPGPGVVIVHGHQLGDRSGGRATAESSVFQQWHQRIFLVAAVSQPGYGRSTGPAEVARSSPAGVASNSIYLSAVLASHLEQDLGEG